MSARTLLLAGALLTAPLVAQTDDKDAALREDEKLVKDARLGTDPASLLAFFRQRTLSAEDRGSIEKLVAQLGSRSFARREEASRRLAKWGPSVASFLAPATRDADIEVSRRAQRLIDDLANGPGTALPCAAARILARERPAEGAAVLLDYLPYADDTFVEEEVLAALVALAADRPGRPADALAPFRRAVQDPLGRKRAAAGYVLGRADRESRAAAKKLLADREPAVRFRAAQGLLAGHDKDAVPAVIDLVAGPPHEFHWQAEELLLRIAGEDGPPAPASADEKERRLYRDRWAKWWAANAAKVDLVKIDQDPPQRGWTVIAQMSTSKVYEIDREGKVRWSVEGLQGPIDAQVLPGDRVLIAEHHGSRVTERNFKGAVLWDKRLEDRPVSAQRLPNGNTFVTTYSALMEFTRDGKQLYNYRPPNTAGRIYAGQKLRNGRLVCVTLDGQVLELDGGSGKVLRSFRSGLDGCYSVQALPGGHFLVASYNTGKVIEVDATGKVHWSHTFASAYHAERLANGHTLIASHGQSRVIEIDRSGKVLAEHNTNGQNVWRVHRR